jgi:hypothetical protein
MRNCLLILVAGVLLCVPFGCNRDTDDDPVVYDPDVDGPPVSIQTPMRDYEIIGKPSVVATRRIALQKGIDDAPPADAPADGDAAPADGDAAPADGDAAPADGDVAPADGDAAPADADADADATPAPADGL